MVKKRKKKILPKKKNGRPSKISTIDLGLLERLAEQGLTDKQMSKILCISEPTLNSYKKKYKRFFKSLKDGKEIADKIIVKALYQRAKGYTHPEEKIFCSEGIIIRAKTLKHYPPDPTSMIMWLTNRKPNEWKNTQKHDISGEIKIPVTIVNKIPAHSNKK